MAGLAAAASVASGLVGMAGAIQQGQASEVAGEYEAEMREMRADEEVAAAQRKAHERREKTDRLQSRQRAEAASGGTSTTSPSIMQIYEETAERGDYLARSDLYGGKSRARGQRDAARAARLKGSAARTGSFLEGAGHFASGVGGAARAKVKYG